MLTGVAEVGTAVECLQQGALDYLAKPVQIEEVRARIAQRAREAPPRRWRTAILQQSYQERLERPAPRADRAGTRNMFLGQIQMAVRMLEKKDVYTRGHSSRVSRVLGEDGGADGVHRRRARPDPARRRAARHREDRHPRPVLNKPGPLTPEEFEEIKKHVIEGEEILEPLRREHPLVLEIVRSHHERIDGTGFPDRLTGEAIPVVARVVAVADAFDAMTTSRAYRPSRSPGEALDELARCAGTALRRAGGHRRSSAPSRMSNGCPSRDR